MKLKTISEAYDWHTFFRGVPNFEAINKVLNGDYDNYQNMYWTRDICIAILYSLSSPHGGSTDDNAYIIEANISLNNKTNIGDEDSLAIGEAPQQKEYGPVWEKWFNDFMPLLPDNLKKQFIDEYNELNHVTQKWNKYASIKKDLIRKGDTRGTHLNIVTTKPIKSRGSNKTIAAYVMEPTPEDHGDYGDYKIIKKIGNGTLDISKIYRPANHFIE